MLGVIAAARAADAPPATPGPAPAAATPPPPVAACGALPRMRSVVLSPDGRTLGWIAARGDEIRVVAFDIASGREKRVYPVDAGLKVRDLAWADDATLLAEVSITSEVDGELGRRKYEFFRTLAIRVDDASPSRRADRVVAPILLLHGAEDTVVPVEQTRTMARALKAAGKKHFHVELPGEDHWLSRAATRTRVLEETERFLRENLGPQ